MKVLDTVLLSTLMLFCTSICAQDPAAVDMSFNPADTGNGVVPWYETAYEHMITQPDGRILVSRSNYATTSYPQAVIRLNEDGTLDESFSCPVNVILTCMALQPDGKVIICCTYQSLGSNTRYLMRLEADGSVDESFNVPGTGFNDQVLSLLLEPDGSITVVGLFTNIDGVVRNNMARIGPAGEVSPNVFQMTWAFDNTVVNNSLFMRHLSNGDIVVGGIDTGYEWEVRTYSPNGDLLDVVSGIDYPMYPLSGDRYLVREPTGLRTFSMDGTQLSYVPFQISGTIYNVNELQNGNLLLTTNDFVTVTGKVCRGILVISPTGDVIEDFPTDQLIWSSGYIGQIIGAFRYGFQPDGKILISSDVFRIEQGSCRRGTIRLLPDGTVDPSFRPVTGFNGPVACAAILDDGRILLGGGFTSYFGYATQGIVRINDDGSYDPSFQTGSGFNGRVEDILVQPDGSVIVAHGGSHYNGTETSEVTKLSDSGTLVASFDAFGEIVTRVTCLAFDAAGRIMAGNAAGYIARFFENGNLDTSFPVGDLNGRPTVINPLASGNYIVGGSYFDSYNSIDNGVPNNIMCLSPTGGIVPWSTTSFNLVGDFYGTGEVVWDIEPLQSGDYFVCGVFSTFYLPYVQYGLMKLGPTGLRLTFNHGIPVNEWGSQIEVLSDGQLLLSGSFETYDDVPRKHLVRISSTGELDEAFDAGTGFYHPQTTGSFFYKSISVLEQDAQGRYLVAGTFTQYNGIGRNRILRLQGNALSTELRSASPVHHARFVATVNGNHLSLTGLEIEGVLTYLVVDALGRTVVRPTVTSVHGGRGSIDLPHLNAGAYILDVRSNDGSRQSTHFVLGDH